MNPQRRGAYRPSMAARLACAAAACEAATLAAATASVREAAASDAANSDDASSRLKETKDSLELQQSRMGLQLMPCAVGAILFVFIGSQ